MFVDTIRTLGHFARAMARSKIHPMNPVRQEHRAWPWFCDSYWHVNNGAYLRYMEFGRIEWIARLKIARKLMRGEVNFLMAGASILYRHELPLMSRFDLETRLVSFDQRWLYFHQDFILLGSPERLAARALVRVQPRNKQGAMDVKDFFAHCEVKALVSPPMPDDLALWLNSANHTLDYIRAYGQAEQEEADKNLDLNHT